MDDDTAGQMSMPNPKENEMISVRASRRKIQIAILAIHSQIQRNATHHKALLFISLWSVMAQIALEMPRKPKFEVIE